MKQSTKLQILLVSKTQATGMSTQIPATSRHVAVRDHQHVCSMGSNFTCINQNILLVLWGQLNSLTSPKNLSPASPKQLPLWCLKKEEQRWPEYLSDEMVRSPYQGSETCEQVLRYSFYSDNHDLWSFEAPPSFVSLLLRHYPMLFKQKSLFLELLTPAFLPLNHCISPPGKFKLFTVADITSIKSCYW